MAENVFKDISAVEVHVDQIIVTRSPAGAAGAATGTYLEVWIAGTKYKIALLADA